MIYLALGIIGCIVGIFEDWQYGCGKTTFVLGAVVAGVAVGEMIG